MAGLKKLQRDEQLGEEDKEYVRMLLVNDSTGEETEEEKRQAESEEEEDIETPRKKKRRERMAQLKSDRTKLVFQMEASEVEAPKPNDDYLDTKFILGTGCIVEAFFSQCKNILTERRAGLTPYMFQCLALLMTNNV